MSPTIGRVDIHVDFTGDALKAQAAAIGKQGGKVSSTAFNQSFLDGVNGLSGDLAKRMNKMGSLSGDRFGLLLEKSLSRRLGSFQSTMIDALNFKDSFQAFRADVGGSEEALRRLNEMMVRARKLNQMGREEILAYREGLKDWADGLDRADAAAEELVTTQSRMRKQLQGVEDVLRNRDAYDRHTKSVGFATLAAGQLRKTLKDLRGEGGISDRQFEDLNARIFKFSVLLPQSEARASSLAEQVRALAEENKRFAGILRDTNLVLGNGKAFDAYVRNTDGLEDAHARLSTSLRDLSRAGKISETQFHVMSDKLNTLSVASAEGARGMDRLTRSNERSTLSLRISSEGIGRWGSQMGAALKKINTAIHDNTTATNGSRAANTSWWKSLSANTRQWTIIIALIASAGAEIAILGSVAGSSLAVFGTALTAVGVASVVAIAAFKGMSGPLEKIAPEARAAAIELANIGKTFGRLQDSIQAAFFADMADPLRSLNAMLPKLEEGLDGVAKATGGVFGQLATSASSANGLAIMQALLGGFAPIITNVGAALGSLISAFGSIFVAALPATQAFAAGLGAMMLKFDSFLKSTDGQTALAGFFGTLLTVFPPLLELVGATGQMFASLVTPQTIADFVGFLGNLTTFMPMLGGLLANLAILNPFGLLAEGLAVFGAALAPLDSGLASVASLLNLGISRAFEALAPALTIVATALSIVLPQLVALAITIGQELTPLLVPLATLFSTILLALMPVIGAAVTLGVAFLNALMPSILSLLEVVMDLIPSLTPVTEIFQQLIPFAVNLGQTLGSTLVAAFEALLPIIMMVVQVLGQNLMNVFSTIVPLIQPLLDVFLALAPVVGQLAMIILNLFVLALDAVLPILPILVDLLSLVVGVINSLMPVIEVLAELIITVLGVAIGIITELLPPLIDIFNILWAAIEPLIPLIVMVVKTAIFPLTIAAEVLIPIIAGLVKIVAALLGPLLGLLAPIVDLIKPLGEAGGGFDQMVDAVDDAISGVKDFGAVVEDVISGVIGWIQDAVGWFSNLFGASSKAGNTGGGGQRGGGAEFATGAIVNRPTYGVFGEAGPEAIIPLNRPLSQVDPAVRALSAFAQGKAGSTVTTSGRSVVVQAGAIVIQTSANPALTASAVLDRFVTDL